MFYVGICEKKNKLKPGPVTIRCLVVVGVLMLNKQRMFQWKTQIEMSKSTNYLDFLKRSPDGPQTVGDGEHRHR